MVSGQVCCGCLLGILGFGCLVMLLLLRFRLMLALWFIVYVCFGLVGLVVCLVGFRGCGWWVMVCLWCLCRDWYVVARLIVFCRVFVGLVLVLFLS